MNRFWTILLISLAVLCCSHVIASAFLGLGDAEALYYCYGKHPSLSYLDHPPLIGWLIYITTFFGGSTMVAVRAVSLICAALSLVLLALITRDIYGPRAGGWSVLLLLATPVFSIGMTAATPDAPLVVLWLSFTWQLVRALADDRPLFWPRIGRPLLLGGLLGLAFLAKYTGACLFVTTLIVVISPKGRVWLGRPGFWLGGVLALGLALPVIAWNMENGWAGLFHRLIWTQTGAGFSLRNLGALLGGQLLYIGPLMLPLLVWAAFELWRRRSSPTQLVLIAASLPTLLFTFGLVLWSQVAEPHWPAAGYLPLFIAAGNLAAHTSTRGKTLARFAIGFGGIALILMHVLVLTPALPLFSSKDNYRPEYDLGNELRGWPEVADTIRALNPNQQPVLAAFYTQCSQLTFVLNRPDDPEVRCVSAEIDDFDIWHDPFVLSETGAFFVTDNRFEHHPETLVPGACSHTSPVTVEIKRGGRWVRRFQIFRLEGCSPPVSN